MLSFRTIIKIGRLGIHAFHRFIECAWFVHISHDAGFEFAFAIFVVKVLVEPSRLFGVSDCTADLVACEEELVDYVAGNVTGSSSDEDERAGRNYWVADRCHVDNLTKLALFDILKS